MAAPFAAPGAGEAVEGSPASDEVLIRRACGEVSTYRLELRGPTANAFSRRSLVDVLTHTRTACVFACWSCCLGVPLNRKSGLPEHGFSNTGRV